MFCLLHSCSWEFQCPVCVHSIREFSPPSHPLCGLGVLLAGTVTEKMFIDESWTFVCWRSLEIRNDKTLLPIDLKLHCKVLPRLGAIINLADESINSDNIDGSRKCSLFQFSITISCSYICIENCYEVRTWQECGSHRSKVNIFLSEHHSDFIFSVVGS